MRGVDSERDLYYHVERAKGGVGLIISGNRLIHPTSASGLPRISAWSYLREGIDVDRRITQAVHEHGTSMFVQLNHFGAVFGSSESPDDWRVLWGPSPTRASPNLGDGAKEMELEDIAEVVEYWGRSAEYSREGGFDGVEVHLCNGYLLHQFLTPLYNRRTDEYGGSFENRLRLARQVISEVRRRVGNDYVVGVRMSLTDFVDGGLGVEDAIEIAQALEADGKIDYINVSAGISTSASMMIAPADIQDGWLLDSITRLKANTPRLPVVAVGGLKYPLQADELVASGKADLVAMTRTQIADPEFANKARSGRQNEIRHCIRANQGCVSHVLRGLPITCTVNPAAGRERRFGADTLAPASASSRWVVVGGGPAGLKAAETAATRGHRVVLIEKQEQLGGQVTLIVKTPYRESVGLLVSDLHAHLQRLGVEIRLGTMADPDLLRELDADQIVVATGARPAYTGQSSIAPLVPALPGHDHTNVVTHWDYLANETQVGTSVVVLDDDGTRCAGGVVERLADKGAEVTVVTRFDTPFPSTKLTLEFPLLYGRLRRKGVTFVTNTWAREFDGETLHTYDLFTGAEDAIGGVDTLVMVTAPEVDDALYRELVDQGMKAHRIGDCLAPRRLDHAIYEGFMAGRELWSHQERYIVEHELESWTVPDNPTS
jgi:2,4-dienoyl-CoA reductase-like NADH-dependent reductase (Old Yellow Enzyme family)/thioredoxin reductase